MKKIFLYSLMLLSAVVFYSCKDNDDEGFGNDRQFMTMFRTTDNANVGSTDPNFCQCIGRNTMRLTWYRVENCYGYEIKWFKASAVQNGTDTLWQQREDEGLMKGHLVVNNPDQIQALIPDLEYSATYRFAIRVLNSADLNDPKNSPWYGHGQQQNWQDYVQLETNQRYECPAVVSYVEFFDDTDPDYKTKFKVHVNKSASTYIWYDEDHGQEIVDTYSNEQLTEFKEHFKEENGNWKVDYITVAPADETSTANVPAGNVPGEPGKYKLTDEDWERGWFLVEGLTPGTQYMVAAWDDAITVKVDASYKNVMEATKADPPADRYLGGDNWVKHMADTVGGKPVDVSSWEVMRIDTIINNYMNASNIGEGQRFILQGGKKYYITSNPTLKKGFTLETDPEDLKKGLRATVYMGSLSEDNKGSNFMIGDDSKNYSDPTVQLKMNSITFRGIDFNSPRVLRATASASGTGNYLMNMYSSSVGFRLSKLEIDDCSVQGAVRGFFRVQGSYDFNISNFIINNCVFYNMGPYASNGGSYNWIHFQLNARPKSNLLNNLRITNNVFYNTAHGTLVNDNGNVPANGFDSSVRWNVDISHNTFVNFCTLSDGYILRTQSIPGGSTMKLTENLFVLTKDEADVNRLMKCAGWRVDKINGGDGSEAAKFIVGKNYSTNTNLTGGQIWTGYAPSSSNGPGKWAKNNPSWFETYGVDGLITIAEDISPEELMKSPNPPHHQDVNLNADAFTCDNINGLYYNNTDKVRNSDIFKLEIGAPRLRETVK